MVNNGDSQLKLLGTHISKLVSGNRIVLPTILRTELKSKNLFLTKGYENCLILLNQDLWQNLTKPILEKSYLQQDFRNTLRFIVGNASQITCDTQGRFVISTNHMKFLNLSPYNLEKEQKIVFIGLINWVEIWNEDEWNKQQDYILKNGSKIAQELENSSNSK